MTPQPAPAPLLIACALGIEQFALRTSDRGGAGGPVTVLRTGMGPRAAERSVTRILADPALSGAAVVATGFCAGLAPGMHPGDLVVAEETRDPGEPFRASGPTYSSKSSRGPFRAAPSTPDPSPAPITSSVVRNGPICSRPAQSRSTWNRRPRS